MSNTIALVVGHKKEKPGAANYHYNISEYQFNNRLTHNIRNKLKDRFPADIKIVYRRTYTQLPYDLNNINPLFTISFHCNAFNTKTSGHEVLYYNNSIKGKYIATILNNNFNKYIPMLKNRGIKSKQEQDRGGYLLKYTNHPCIIAEPFFIDNDGDFEYIIEHNSNLIQSYVDSIKHCYDYLTKQDN